MKLSKLLFITGVLLLTACQAEQMPEESGTVSIETTAAVLPQEDFGNEEAAAFCETVEDVTDNSTETADSSAIETSDFYTVSDLAGTWQINGEKTQAANERSLAEEFGTGIHLGNEMLLSEHGDFSYYVSINQGEKAPGIWMEL